MHLPRGLRARQRCTAETPTAARAMRADADEGAADEAARTASLARRRHAGLSLACVRRDRVRRRGCARVARRALEPATPRSSASGAPHRTTSSPWAGRSANGTPSSSCTTTARAGRDLAPGGTETFWWAQRHERRPTCGSSGRRAHHALGRREVHGAHVGHDRDALRRVGGGSATTSGRSAGRRARPTRAERRRPALRRNALVAGRPCPDARARVLQGLGRLARRRLRRGRGGDRLAPERAGNGRSSRARRSRQGTLLTVNGCGPNEVYAVGGRDVLRSDGATWTRLDVSDSLGTT